MDWLEAFMLVRIVPAERYQVELLLTKILPKRYPEYTFSDLLDILEGAISRKGRKFVEQPFTFKRMEKTLTRAIRQKKATEKRLKTLERKRLREEIREAYYMIGSGEAHKWILKGRPEKLVHNDSELIDRVSQQWRSN